MLVSSISPRRTELDRRVEKERKREEEKERQSHVVESHLSSLCSFILR